MDSRRITEKALSILRVEITAVADWWAALNTLREIHNSYLFLETLERDEYVTKTLRAATSRLVGWADSVLALDSFKDFYPYSKENFVANTKLIRDHYASFDIREHYDKQPPGSLVENRDKMCKAMSDYLESAGWTMSCEDSTLFQWIDPIEGMFHRTDFAVFLQWERDKTERG